MPRLIRNILIISNLEALGDESTHIKYDCPFCGTTIDIIDKNLYSCKPCELAIVFGEWDIIQDVADLVEAGPKGPMMID